jgi:hypothetical protein
LSRAFKNKKIEEFNRKIEAIETRKRQAEKRKRREEREKAMLQFEQEFVKLRTQRQIEGRGGEEEEGGEQLTEDEWHYYKGAYDYMQRKGLTVPPFQLSSTLPAFQRWLANEKRQQQQQ